jgi:hypothetical protein
MPSPSCQFADRSGNGSLIWVIARQGIQMAHFHQDGIDPTMEIEDLLHSTRGLLEGVNAAKRLYGEQFSPDFNVFDLSRR